LSEEAAAVVMTDAAVAPGMSAPFFCHWYENGAVPPATTENVAVSPVATD
jgi:hypothetical protein